MTLVMHEAMRYRDQVCLTAFLQECSLWLFFVLASLNTLVYLFVVFEEFCNLFFANAFFIMKPLLRLESFLLFMNLVQYFDLASNIREVHLEFG